MYIVIFNEVSNQIETQGQKVGKKMENLGTTMIKNQNRVYIHSTLKYNSPLWDQTFISFTVRKLQRMGGGDQIRLHMSYYVKWAYQKFMVVIMIFRRILHRKTDIPHCSRVACYHSFISQDFFYFSSFIHNGGN